MLLSKKTTLILVAFAIIGMATVMAARYTDACRLKEVTYNHKPLENWEKRFGLAAEKSVVLQPVDSLAQLLLTSDRVFKVDIDYDLPDRIDIMTNNFSPVCFLLDAARGVLYGLTDGGRVVSLDNSSVDWDHPVITSVQAGPVYRYCPDARVAVLVNQLERLRKANIDLYRLIDEIDLGHQACALVTLAGLPYRLKVRAENFHDEMIQFVEFVSRFAPDLSGVTSIDMRFDNMIVCAGGDR